MSLISVIIPAYNAEKELGKCIESLLQQTYSGFEIILINDGSTDNTGEICDRYSCIDSRIYVIHNENRGVSAARNCGIEEAKGEFITFIDADDIVDKNYLSVLISAIADNDVAVCDVTVEDNEKEIRRFTLPSGVLKQPESMNELFVRRNLNSGPYAKLFRRDIVGDIRFPLIKAYEDIIFVKNVFAHVRYVAVTNQTKYHYIQNSSGAMSSFKKSPSLDIVNVTDELLDYIINHDDLSPECFYITASHLMQYVIPMLPTPAITEKEFVGAVQKLYSKYKKSILQCRAFPWKEKAVYLAFTSGYLYYERKIVKLKYNHEIDF